MGTALPGRKSPCFPGLEVLSDQEQSRPTCSYSLVQPHCSQRCWTKSWWVLQPGSELSLFSRGNTRQLSCLDCLDFPKNFRGLSMASVMTRGVTGQRDEEHLSFFASDFCQKNPRKSCWKSLVLPQCSAARLAFSEDIPALSTTVLNCFFSFSNVLTATGRVGHKPGLLEPGTKMSIPDFLQPRSTGESWQLSVTCTGEVEPAFQREKGYVPLGWPGGAQQAEQCWPLLASKASPLLPHSQNVGVQGSHMDAGSRGGLSGGDSRCGSSSRATGAGQRGRETRRAFLMDEYLGSVSQRV